MAIAGHQIGQALCDALQLPKHTSSFVLRVETGRIVSVECEYYPEDGDGIVTALAEYELVRRPSAAAAEPDPMHFDTWMRLRTEAAHVDYQSRMKVLAERDGAPARARRLEEITAMASSFVKPLERD